MISGCLSSAVHTAALSRRPLAATLCSWGFCRTCLSLSTQLMHSSSEVKDADAGGRARFSYLAPVNKRTLIDAVSIDISKLLAWGVASLIHAS